VPLLRLEDSLLLVVDVQERLHPHIASGANVMARCLWLAKAARRLGVPVLTSEQYPSGLGPTVPVLAAEVPAEGLRAKIHFSCVADGCFEGIEAWSRRQVVVCGTEAHVCVFQTAIDLLASGRQVYVVADAVGSRSPASAETALARLRDHGAEIVNGEMVVFEWLRRAGTPLFREISRDFLR